MAGSWTAGLKDLDEQGLGDSAASPLTAAGLDPDVVRANLGLLTGTQSDTPSGRPAPPQRTGTMAAQPMGTEPPAQPVASAKQAGAVGGAGAPPDPAATPDTPYAEAMGGLQNLGKMETQANKAADDIQTTDPNLTAMQQRRAQLAAQPDLYDPKTGKMRDSVQVFNPDTGQMEDVAPKPSAGRRVWRGVRGGLVGLLTGGIPGAALGAIDPALERGGEAYGAPNKAYERDIDRNQNALGATDTGIKDELEVWKQASLAAKDKASQLNTNARIDNDRVVGAKDLITAQADQTKAGYESPQSKADADALLSRQKFTDNESNLKAIEARVGKLPPATAAYVMMNGKMPDPKQPREPSAEEIELGQARSTFAKQNGRAPNYDEYIKMVQGLRGRDNEKPTPQQIRSIQDKKAAEIQKAQAKFATAFGSRLPGAVDEYALSLQLAQDQFEQAAADFSVAGDHYKVTVDPKGNPTWTPQNAPPAAAPAGQFAVTTPAGTITFPSQAAADNYKKAAGIK